MARVPLIEELPNWLDPEEVASRFVRWPHLLFLDSSDRVSRLGRYSFVAADPVSWLTISDDDAPWDAIRAFIGDDPVELVEGLPPFQGGVAGLLGYELSHSIERFARPARDEFQTPPVALGRYDWVIAFDHRQGRAWLIAHSAERLREALQALEMAPANLDLDPTPYANCRRDVEPRFALPGLVDVASNFDRDAYLKAIARAVEYIHAGDCFQVNIAQRLLAPLREHPWALYRRLRRRNPSPFGAYFDLGDFAIASSSPERFLRVSGRQVETRPIKGTRRRHPHPMADDAIRDELADSAKDRAENVMIVDLSRNDLGRVCEFGTVRVSSVCAVETYQYVHHLVSVVEGRLRPDRDAIDLLRASFPGGSITGAPKVRALEIISEIEGVARGSYCGNLGYLGFGESIDLNILIRTFTAGGGWVQFPVGGGIVADSDPAQEYEETLHKAAGLLAALRAE